MMSSGSLPSASPRSNLPARVIILFLLAIISGLLLALLIRLGYPLAYLFMIFFVASVLGLVSGFGARAILMKHGLGWQLLACPAAMFSGMFALGMATGWKYGLGPLTFNIGRFDWSALIQVLTGLLVAGMSLMAWRKPAPGRSPTREVDLSRNLVQQQPQPIPAAPQNLVKTIPVKKNAISIPTAIASNQVTTNKSRKSRTIKTDAKKPATAWTKRRSSRADVQFSASEKFRCPYCLEPVLPNDARGIVECKICHTPHHADCWAITGVCQVPHQNS